MSAVREMQKEHACGTSDNILDNNFEVNGKLAFMRHDQKMGMDRV